MWVATAPRDTETLGLTYQHQGSMSDSSISGSGRCTTITARKNQAVKIDPFNITNVFLNYTVKGSSYLRGSKLRFSINNLLDRHSIVGVNPVSTASNAPAAGDI